MHLAVAVAQVHVRDPPLEPRDLLRTARARGAGARCRSWPSRSASRRRRGSWSIVSTLFTSDSLNGSSSIAISSPSCLRVFPTLARVLHARLPLLGRRDDLLLPDVFADDQQQVVAPNSLHRSRYFFTRSTWNRCTRRVEVDQPDGDAADALDRQAELRGGRA